MKKINVERLCIVLCVVIVIFGAGVHLYRWWRVSSLEAQARAAEEKAAELERRAKEAAAAKEAEEKAKLAAEADKVLETVITIDDALPEEYKQIGEEFYKEAKAITEVLIALNKAQNNADYRTVTGREGIEFMTEEYKQQIIAEAEETIKSYQEDQAVVNFKALKIREMQIGTDTAEVIYDLTTEHKTIKGDYTWTLRCKSRLVKKGDRWLVNNEEVLGRVVVDEK